MAFVAQLPVAVAPFDQQVQAWLLSPLLTLLFFVILMKALLELPLSYIGTLLVVLALTLRKGRTIPVPTAYQKATVKVEAKHEKEPFGSRYRGTNAGFII